MDILIATTRPDAWLAFTTRLNTEGMASELVKCGGDILEAAVKAPPALAIFDQDLPDGEPLELARKLLYVNAMVNIAVVDTRDEETFHQVFEGLGVMDRLSPAPTAADGEVICQRLRLILGLTQQVSVH